MEAVLIPAKTLISINGIPCKLAVDTIIETAYTNMASLTGYHYAHLPDDSYAAPPSSVTPPERQA